MIGQTVAHYRIRALLGGGGMGVIYRAEDTRLGREVALKFLPPARLGDDLAMSRFLREARLAALLNHPNICTIYDVGEHQGQPFIAMELLDGSTLTHRIAGQPIPVDQVLAIGAEIADALGTAHAKGIVHRDIKPANLFLIASGHAKVLDFGIAKLPGFTAAVDQATPTRTAEPALTEHGTTIGTLAYMSPEQALGEDLDARTDLFSLGAVLYEMLTGVAPFRGQTDAALLDAILHASPINPIRLNPDVPPDLDAVVMKALEKDKRLRYQSAADLQADLTRLSQLSTMRKFATAPAVTRGLWRWAAAAGVLAGLIAAVAYWPSRNAQALGEADVILLTDIANTTGDAVFDGTLRQAVAVKLEESPFLNVLPDARVREMLAFMKLAPDTRVTADIGRDMCQRRGLKALLTGEIAAVGSHYAVTLHAMDCQTGDTLARELVEAPAKEQVLATVGTATVTLRERLGESLASIQKLNTPIEQATTSSLEALKALAQGDALRAQGKRQEALPMFKRAIELDPDFALAHARLGTTYQNFFELVLAAQHRTRAFELRARASERERFYIDAAYYDVVHDRLKSRATYEQWIQTYPRDAVPHNNLGVLDSGDGRIPAAEEHYAAATRLDPSVELMQTNLIAAQLTLGWLDAAERSLKSAVARLGETARLQEVSYRLAFQKGDEAALTRLTSQATDGSPLAVTVAQAELHRGKLASSRAMLLRQAREYERRGLSELAAFNLAGQAHEETLAGDYRFAREHQVDIERLAPAGSLPRRVFAVAVALDPSTRTIEPWMPAEPPAGASMQYRIVAVLPRALAALNAGRPQEAIALLSPLADAFVVEGPGLGAMLVYGRAMLQHGDAPGAIAQFSRIVDHPGLDVLSIQHAVVHVWLGRAYAHAGRTGEARQAYERFFDLWKDADADVPILAQARAERAKLGR
jgi:tetratricopeptide (TPR) repeat protein/tRNA A-37 threonylcarbamoyl transferase component Bud32